jgi:hypothetical protein
VRGFLCVDPERNEAHHSPFPLERCLDLAAFSEFLSKGQPHDRVSKNQRRSPRPGGGDFVPAK